MDNVSITINDVIHSVNITALQSVETVNITVGDLVIPVIEGITAMGIPGNISAFTYGNVIFSGANLSVNTLVQNSSQIIQFSASSPDLSGYRQTANDSQLQFTSANSIFQPAGNYLTTAAQSDHAHTQYRNVNNDSQLQFTSAMGAYLTTAAQSNHNHTEFINTSKEGNFFLTANSSLLQLSGAYLTTAMQSASSSVFAKTGVTTASKTGSEMAATLNTNGLSLEIPKWVTNAVGGAGISLGNSQSSNVFSSGAVIFSANNATINTSHDGASQYIRVSVGNYLTTAAASDHTHSNLYQSTGNYLTTAAQSNHTHDYQSTGNYLTTAMVSNAGSNFIGLNSAVTNITATINSSGISISNPGWLTTAAQSDHSHGSPTLALTNLTGTTASASNGFTISLSAAAPGAGGGTTFSSYQNCYLAASAQSSGGQNVIWFAPFSITTPVSVSSIGIMASYTGTFTSDSPAQFGQTIDLAIYQQNSTNASVYDTIWSSAFWMIVWNSGTSSMSVLYQTTNTAYTVSSAGTGLAANVTGIRLHTLPLSSLFGTGNYAFGYRQSTSSASYSALMRTYGIVHDIIAPAAGYIGSATNNSIGIVYAGTYTVTSGSIYSQINITGTRRLNNRVPFFMMGI